MANFPIFTYFQFALICLPKMENDEAKNANKASENAVETRTSKDKVWDTVKKVLRDKSNKFHKINSKEINKYF